MRRNFLKRLAACIALIALFLGFLLSTASCKKEDPLPECMVEEYGWIEVENRTGYSADVDATYHIDEVNDVRFIGHNESHTYVMFAGVVYIWISIDGEEWFYETYALDPCEDLLYTWYLDKKKSTNAGLILEVSKNGKVIKTVTEFNSVTRDI